MKKLTALFSALILMFAFSAAHADDYRVVVNGTFLEAEVPPVNVEGRILVPFRAIAEALSAEVGWDEASRTVTVTLGGSQASLQIDNPAAIIDGQTVQMDVPAQIINSRTMVPVRFVSEALKADVLWDSSTNTAIVSTSSPLYSPIASYSFDEGSGARVFDGAGSFNGVLCGSARRGSGISGSAADLNGSYQYVTLKKGLMNGLGSCTVSAWVYFNKNEQNSRVFDFGSSNEKYMFLTGNSSDGTLRFAVTNSSSGGEQVIDCDNSALLDGNWHHIAVTLDGGAGVLYLDGKETGRNGQMNLTPKDLGDFTRCYIGKSQWADPYFNGRVDNFNVYNRALASAEIGEIYSKKR